MKRDIKNVRGQGVFCRWLRQTTGGIAIYMALMIPVLTGAIGMAIDASESYLMQERLSRALDAAALAAAGSSNLESQADIQARVDEFMQANYPVGKIGSPYNIQVVVNGDYITVSASANYNTTFLRFIGFDTITSNKSATVQRQVQGIEVALVLDNTGSMSYQPPGEDKENIEALRDASTDFVNIMFSKANKPSDVRIGLVPFANTVRVGLYGLGMVPDPFTGDPTGETYNDGQAFITLPAGKTVSNFYAGNSGTNPDGSFSQSNSDMNNSNRGKWYGCVIEHRDGGYDINSDDNDPYPNDVTDNYTGPWDIYQYSTLRYRYGVYSIRPYYYANESCPYANLMPLTSDQTKLLNGIKTMQANGNTQGNTGMIWGLRVISPEAPFTEGSAWGSENWRKAIIIMTDGDNTWDSNYSEYWLSQRNGNISKTTLDERFTDVCNLLREKKVLVYTIIFKSEDDPTQYTKDLYKNCATDPDTMYFYAPTQEDLHGVFDQIAHALSNLHLTQ